MAAPQDVKRYLAYWLQLGKRLVTHNGDRYHDPQPIFKQGDYSPEFERCWQIAIDPASKDCYLEGTETTIAELLSEEWLIEDCARCQIAVSIPVTGHPVPCCPCFDMPYWPNLEMPPPRDLVDTQAYLNQLKARLQAWQPTVPVTQAQADPPPHDCPLRLYQQRSRAS